jgi:DNA-binding LacI/PurR family transcriptional regulator
VRVPQDVAVIGFNDNEIDDCMDPPLASVERNDDQVADVIDEILFTRLIHPELPPQRRYVSMRFVWRESAGRRRDTG